jgi:hypothetical protein
MLVLAALYACGPFATDPIAKRLLLAFAALFGAYLIVYFALGGDARDLPLTVFLNDLVLALGLVAMIECVRSYYASPSHASCGVAGVPGFHAESGRRKS